MPSVPTSRSTSSSRPAAATVPRPPGPTVPVACASSTISLQRWLRASSQEALERRPVAVHREEAVGDDQRRPRAGRAQPPGKVLEVAVAVDEGLGPRQPASVDDAGVVELVAEDDLAALREGGDGAGVGEVSGPEQERRVVALERGQPLLEGAVRVHAAGDQARGAGPGAPPDRRLGGRFAHQRVAGEAEVVVGAEQQDRAAVEQDLGPLGALDQAQPPVEPRPAELLQPLGDLGHAADRFGYGGGFFAFLITRSWVEGSQKSASS